MVTLLLAVEFVLKLLNACIGRVEDSLKIKQEKCFVKSSTFCHVLGLCWRNGDFTFTGCISAELSGFRKC